MNQLTDEQIKIRAWCEARNDKVRQELREKRLPSANELLEATQ